MKKKNNPLIFEISLIILRRDGVPNLELRRRTSDIETIKTLVSAALHNKPVIVLPVFRDRLQSLSGLVGTGILNYNAENNE